MIFSAFDQLDVEFILKPLVARCRLRRLPLARLVGDRLRARTRISQGLFVSRDRSVRLGLGVALPLRNRQRCASGDSSIIEPTRGNATFAMIT